MPTLEIDQFVCERDGYPLFKPLSFTVQPGELVQIAGPNGAGKTTFLRAICGLFDQWQGNLSWDGVAMRHPDYAVKSELLYLGHAPGVTKALTARENLKWAFGIRGETAEFNVTDALEQVGLAGYEDVPCHQMSAGQARRVALARLYVTRSSVWILDEPFTAIDKKGVENLETLFQLHASKGGTVLLTTHQPLTRVQDVRLIALSPNVQHSQVEVAG